MPSRGQRFLLPACALAGAWLAVGGVAGFSEVFLLLTPAFVLALPLIAGHYIGAERLCRVASQRSPITSRTPAIEFAPRARRGVLPRGGLLIAASLAVRPPPSVLSPH
jgi:hypothetical protein